MTLHILAVEDELLNQKMLQFLFKEANVEVEVVGTGKEAINIMDTRHDEFQLVLMDLGLPDIDGITATKQIRENELKKGLKEKYICAFTASPEKEQECRNAGMNDFVTKPMNLDKLNYVLQEASRVESRPKLRR